MRDDLDKFLLRHAIFDRTLNVKRELLRAVHGDKCGHRGKTTIPLRESRPLPHISEKDVFSQIRKFRCDVTNSFVCSCASFLVHRYSQRISIVQIFSRKITGGLWLKLWQAAEKRCLYAGLNCSGGL